MVCFDRPLSAAARLWPLLCVLALVGSAPCRAQESWQAVTSDTLLVFGRPARAGVATAPVAGDYRRYLAPASGLFLVRKGTGFGDDLYLDGFKRGEIALTLDGERLTTACPNRMDTHVGRFHPLEIRTVTVDRSGAGQQAGLGGVVSLERSEPDVPWRGAAYLAGAGGRSEAVDAGLILEKDRLRLLGRWSVEQAWLDGHGRGFEDLYGYVDLRRQTQAELGLQGQRGPADFHLAFQSSRDHLFPYLQMDERSTEFTTAGVTAHGAGIYFNRTAHLMDSGLRAGSYKITEAENLNWGVTADWGEVYGRYWDARNRMGSLASHMLPAVWRWGATLGPVQRQDEHFSAQVRFGVAVTRAGDKDALELNPLYADEDDNEVTSWPLAAVISLRGGERPAGRLQLELVRTAPEPEQQFIGLRKPAGMPDWFGNPALRDPLRHTLRGELLWSRVNMQAYFTYVWDYPYLVNSAGNTTYGGINALLAGIGIDGDWRHLRLGLSWNWGEEAEMHSPLAEIQPLTAYVRLKAPQIGPASGWLQATREFGQDRVDLYLQERTTPAWTRLDLGLVLMQGDVRLELGVENLADVDYWRHLSYLRNPFASGLAVHEAGRTGRLVVIYQPE